MKANVQQLVGEVCMTYQDGEKLHSAYRPTFDAGETVELDFRGTRIFVSQFFNAAVGQLLEKYDIQEVRRRLHVTNLPPAGHGLLRRSVENAEHYYRDPKYQETLDQVLTAHAVES